jgi:sigma-B regulation protein RsbU (phosphoserine phosphatase)
MFVQDTLIGVLHVGEKRSGKLFTKEDTELLLIVASQAAVAIENARLHLSEIEKQKMDHQLQLARRIQDSLLPREQPSMPGLDIAGISIPAQSVGGDYFDFIPLDDHRILLAIADVSGKGMPAALYMSKVQGMVQLAAQMYHSPKEILVQVNRRMTAAMEKSAFITMILALFDTRSGEVLLCRAGHTLPLLLHGSTVCSLPAAGIGMGLEKGAMFESELEEVRLHCVPGQVFVFYSDGVTEMMNRAREEFGEERLLALVRDEREGSAADIQRAVISAIQQFRGDMEQHDDVTLLVVKTDKMG